MDNLYMHMLATPPSNHRSATRIPVGWCRFAGAALLTASITVMASQSAVVTSALKGISLRSSSSNKPVYTLLDQSGSNYLLNSSVQIELSPRPTEALHSGLPLVVLTSIRVERHHRWWFDSVIANVEVRHRLEYQQLARRYAVARLFNGERSTHSTLQSALREVARLDRFPLIDAELIEPDASYIGRLALSLDTAALPTPLRPQTYLSSAWKLLSEVHTWAID